MLHVSSVIWPKVLEQKVWVSHTCACYIVYILFLLSDISELDSKMQYLVYENHSKFIKASETIREVILVFVRVTVPF